MYLMMTNVRMKTCLNQKIIKISNLIQAMKNSVCPKTKVIRRPNFSESRICPNFPNYEFNTRHDNREVILLNFSKAELLRIFTFESRICPNIYRMFRSVDWTHDMIIVKWHFFIFIHLTRAETLRSDKCATGSIHANGSMTINVIPC